MTVNFSADEPDDGDDWDDWDDWSDWSDWDEHHDSERYEPDWLYDDDVRIDFAFDTNERRLACVNTVGLWRMGIPELFIRPPRNYESGNVVLDARLAVFLATALIHLGYGLLAADGFDVPPYRAELDGRQVRFWLGAQEPPFEQLAIVLGPEVDTVIRVDCSLW